MTCPVHDLGGVEWDACTCKPTSDLDGFDVYAFVGEDELGSGEVGLKQGFTPVGLIPLVAVRRDKIDRYYIIDQLQKQATEYGKTIRLVRLTYAETVRTIEPMSDS